MQCIMLQNGTMHQLKSEKPNTAVSVDPQSPSVPQCPSVHTILSAPLWTVLLKLQYVIFLTLALSIDSQCIILSPRIHYFLIGTQEKSFEVFVHFLNLIY